MSNKIQHPVQLTLVALGLGWVFNHLFYGQTIGVNVLLYAGALVVALLALGRSESVPFLKTNRWLLLPLTFFAVMVFVRANPFLTFLNIGAVLLLLMLLAYGYSADSIHTFGLRDYFKVPLKVMGNAQVGGYGTVKAASQRVGSDAPPLTAIRHNAMPVARGVVLATPIVLVFAMLLISADALFAQRVNDLFELEFLPDMFDWVGRGTLTVVTGWLAAGSLTYALTRDSRKIKAKVAATEVTATLQAKIAQRFTLGFVESTVILNAVNALFGAFMWVQFAYLFGGTQNINVDGFTYAEYARRGFFELVAVAVLTMGLILLLKTFTRRDGQRQAIVFNASSTIIVAFVTFMLVSAFRRLQLYEMTYGFTELRLYPHVFTVWLGIAFAWFVYALWRNPNRVAIGFFICALGYVGTLDVINVDKFIVEQNYARFQQLGESGDVFARNNDVWRYMDTYYFTELSADSYPALVDLLNTLEAQGIDNEETQRLNSFLLSNGQQLARELEGQSLYAFHLADQRAFDSLYQQYGDQLYAEKER